MVPGSQYNLHLLTHALDFFFIIISYHCIFPFWRMFDFLSVVSKLQKESKQAKAAATIEQQA